MRDRFKNLIGLRFNKWTVLRVGENKGKGTGASWVCICDCGTIRTVRGDVLRLGYSRNCGCVRKVNRIKSVTKHGLLAHKKYTYEYGVWVGMRRRCRNPKDKSYNNYGGRGIIICPQWSSFKIFLDDMGIAPSKNYSLDRINNNGNYEPNNCRWATQLQQALNRRSNVIIQHNGESKVLKEWLTYFGRSTAYSLFYKMKKSGWEDVDILNFFENNPVKKRVSSKLINI